MIPTKFAETLQPTIKSWLAQANHIFKPLLFEAATSTRRFTIAIDEFTDFLFLPKLYQHIEAHAPHVELHIKHILPVNGKAILESNDIDLAICSLHKYEELKNASYEILFREKMVCLAKHNHPLFNSPLTLKKYLSAKHITLIPKNHDTPHLVDYILQNLGCQRNITLRTTNIVPALYTVLNSHLIATIPEGLAKEAARLFKAEIKPCPFSIPDATFLQVWHNFTELDSGCQWLRKTVKELSTHISNKG